MARTYVKKDGQWELVNVLYAKDSGAWQTVKAGYVKNSGNWDQFYAGITVTLSSGTEYQSTAVYTSNLGANAHWYSIDISGAVTYQGQASTKAWVAGSKMFASIENVANPQVRSNNVGDYAIQANYTGTDASYNIPAAIPDQFGTIAPASVSAEMWGGGTSGRGGHTYVNMGTTTGTVYYVVASQGVWNNGFSGVCRFQWDRFGCGSQDQVSNGWSGLFSAHPYSNTTSYRDASKITADSNIWGIAGGMSVEGQVGGGATGGGPRGASQASHGSFYLPNINNACYSSCSGISGAVFRTCPSRLIGSWIASGFETCTYATGGGGYYPGGSSTNPPCSSAGTGGGSGFVGSAAGAGSTTSRGSGSNQSNSPYYTGNSKMAIRIR